MNRDLTQGKPLQVIFTFYIPVLIGSLFQQFYNMADTIIVGKLLGVKALAAVGTTGALLFLVLGFVIGLCSGFAIPMAQFYGAKDMRNVKKCIVNAFFLTIVIMVVLTTIALLSTDLLLRIMSTPEDIYRDAYAYISVIFAGLGAAMFYNLLNCISRALGDVKTPLYFLIFASVLNVLLDLLFIHVFQMGTAGAAYATVTAQAAAAVLCFIYMYRKYSVMRVRKADIQIDLQINKRLFFTGLPMALQFSITAVGAIIVQAAVNSFGSDIVAAVTAANKVSMFITQPLETMGITMATYCGQNLGAGRWDRIRDGVKKSNLVILLYSLVAFGIIYVFGDVFAMLFIRKEDIGILPVIQQFLRINSMFYWSLGLLLIFRNSIQGIGYSLPAMAAGIMELAARILIAAGFVGAFGFYAICFANPVAWVFADILLLVVYCYIIKKKAIPDES